MRKSATPTLPGVRAVAAAVPIQPVENPIICPPYDEPADHWIYDKDTGAASQAGLRRPASYWYKDKRTGSAQQTLFQEESRDDLPLVNMLRGDVKRWRESEYRGATQVTKQLLQWWASPKRDRRLFFCQREAVETVIYLAELRMPGKSSRTKFQNFALSDDNLKRLLHGEPMRGVELSNQSFWPKLIDQPADAGMLPLRRLGCKMATGAGKTVVMAQLIAWAFCNRGVNPESREFPNAVLVCAPNLTVKERLQVLRPECPANYYSAFDLVPVGLRPYLQAGKVLVENWHKFAPESEHKEGDKTYAVVDKGPETPETLARRVLGDLYDRMPIMVLNDEGHHCWRPALLPPEDETDEPKAKGRKKKAIEEDAFAATEDEAVEARVWLQGLDFINNSPGDSKPGIALCLDLSATPFYLQGSGHPEGQPFPWLVSDFGLVDAIESGIVKIPRLPVKDNSGKKDEAGRPDPKYFRLWHHIVEGLKKHEKLGSGKPKPEPCYREAQGALTLLAGHWKEKLDYFQQSTANQERIPPVMILVCDNTDIADYFYRKISGESESDAVTEQDVEDVLGGDEEDEEATPKKGKPKKTVVYGSGEILPELSNTADRKYTVRIDSKLLADAESADPSKGKKTAAEELRRVIATVGKPGEPGEHVRCVVSVSMLTEGWDANNVTHILGIRAFGSQLLCEQVVGRGLRRMDYTPNKETGLLDAEYVDVYGIPFSVIPYKGRAVHEKAPEDKPKHRVWAVPDRAGMEIKFPLVKGYVFALHRGLLTCDVNDIEAISVNPKIEPTHMYLRPTAGYQDCEKPGIIPFGGESMTRDAYHANTHHQTILFQITQKIIDDLLSATEAGANKKAKVLRLFSRHHLFPQVYRFVSEFVERRVNLNGNDPREIGLVTYAERIVERLREAIYPDSDQGEPPLLPILDRYRPMGTTEKVDFTTTRPVVPTRLSHINLVVLDSDWEKKAAAALDDCTLVDCFARNDHLGLEIPYEHLGAKHDYTPDFLVRLKSKLRVLLEIKGFEVHNPELNAAKHTAARRWVTAVNNLNDPDFGQWQFAIVREVDMADLLPQLNKAIATHEQRLKLSG